MICRSSATTYGDSGPTTSVEFANGSTATSIGTTEIKVAGELKVKAIVFEDDALMADLISVSQIVNERNCDVLFSREKGISGQQVYEKGNSHRTKR